MTSLLLLAGRTVNRSYGKSSKTSNTFLFLVSKKLVLMAGIQKMLVKIANREGPDQTASKEAV